MEKKRLTRLTEIHLLLQSKSMVNASEMAGKFGVSVRTIYRDIRALEEAGVPIITEEGKGYSLMPGYNLPPVMFDEAEANALITAGQILAQYQEASLVANYEKALQKIKAVLKYSQKGKADLLEQRLQFRPALAAKSTSAVLIQLQTAITNFKLVHLRYTSLQNETTERLIEPFALYSTFENWVLIAHCRLRGAFRAFRLDKIDELELLETAFEPHNMTLEQYIAECKSKYS